MTRRVLMTADAVGGVWTYAVDLAAALADEDVEVRLAVMGPAPTAEQRAAAGAAGLAVDHAPYALEWTDDPWSDVDAAADWLLSLERELHPDVVHLNGYTHATLPWASPTVVVAHSDVVSWWRAVHGSSPPGRYDDYRTRVADGLRAADAVVAPTASVLRDLTASYGFRGGVVIANGRDSSWVQPLPKEPLICAAGRTWDQAKNLQSVVAAAAELPWPVQVLGGRPWPEVAVLMLQASVFVAPARYEPFGLAPLEAALAGCALVLGDIDSLREVWRDAAVYVDPDDSGALVAAIERLSSDTGLLADMAERAVRRGRDYSATSMASAYLRLYRSLPVAAVTR